MNWHNPLYWLSPLVGGAAVLIGFAAVSVPSLASKGFGLQTEGSGLNYVRITGARDIFIGLVILMLCWHEDSASLSDVFFITAFVSCVDFYLTYTKGSKLFSIVHLAGIVFFLAYGAWLVV